MGFQVNGEGFLGHVDEMLVIVEVQQLLVDHCCAERRRYEIELSGMIIC